MKVGIYGGSFNPIHFGHIGLADYVLAHTDLDEVWMLVSPNNPMKDASILADEHQRLEAVRQAIAGHTGIVASDFEFSLPRPSYTANTLRELAKAYPEHTFSLIIGEDNWCIFDRWRESDYILSNYRIIVYPRHAGTQKTSPYPMSDKVMYMDGAPYFDISSTELRQRGL